MGECLRLSQHAGLPRPASDESLDGRGASDNLLAHTNSSKGAVQQPVSFQSPQSRPSQDTDDSLHVMSCHAPLPSALI